MYNITVGQYHPSTICVEIGKLADSLRDLKEVLESEYPQDSLAEYIEIYARTDEIMPSDRTLGFVVVNRDKKVISLSFSKIDSALKEEIQKIVEPYQKDNYNVELDLQ